MATHNPIHAAHAEAALVGSEIVPQDRSYWKTFFSICGEITLDYLAILSGTIAGYYLCRSLHISRLPVAVIPYFLAFSLQYGFFFVLLMRSYHGYDQMYSLLNVRESERIVRSSFNSLILYMVTVYFTQRWMPAVMLIISWLLITLFVLSQRHATAAWFSRWKAKYTRKQRILIYGAGKDARRLFSSLLKSPHLGLVPVAFIDEEHLSNERVLFSHDYKRSDHAPILNRRLTPELFRDLNVQALVIAEPASSAQRMAEVLAVAAANSIDISYVGTTQYHAHDRPTAVRIVDGLLITSYSTAKVDSVVYPLLKRVLDLTVSVIFLFLTVPFWIFIAAWIKATSPGPIFFRQERIGRHGKTFELLKFRSMYSDAPKFAESPQDSSDPRITKPGRFLRKTSLDELPQLFNVLAGDMSLVGPRPEMPYIVEQYTVMERERLCVPQGLTGIWQLSADRKYAIHESVEYDLYYIENRSFCLDVAVLIHTAIFAAKGI